MTGSVKGRLNWTFNRDIDGNREYKLLSLVKCTDVTDGPKTAFLASGLPAIGAYWNYGNDTDAYAFCLPTGTARPVVTREPGYWWEVENTFSTKPLRRCQDTQIENPLSEPQGISGTFVKYTRSLERDANGNCILSSSHELIEGLERDANRFSVVIEQNVSTLGLATFAAMIDCLNDATLWGLAAGKVKLSNVSFSRKLYGSCTYYYTRRFEFDIDFLGFDIIEVADAGFKVFDDDRYPDTPEFRANPNNYILAQDGRGGNPPKKVLLDGNGDRLLDPLNPVFLDPIPVYPRVNMLTLSIPTSL